MIGDAEECNIKLCLGLGNGEKSQNSNKSETVPVAACLDLSFTLCPKQEAMDVQVLRKPDEDNYFNNDSQNDNYIARRKKLKLTKEQSSFLEDSFKLHTSLNSFQKRALAERLNLKPRQVEVWFQNRRARTKLKQNQLDYEILKKCCESLSDENKRLKKELQELKSEESGKSPLFIAKAAVLCPSCEKIIRTK